MKHTVSNVLTDSQDHPNHSMATLSSKSQANQKYQPTYEEKGKREHALSEFLIELKEDHKTLSDKSLIIEMKRRGFADYDRNKLYRDKKSLAQRNTFIRDLTEANVSKFYEDIWTRLDTLASDAFNIYNKLHDRGTKEARAIGYYINHITEQQDALMKGPMMNISNALGMRKIAQLEQDSERLRNLLIKHEIDPESGQKIAN